MHRYLPNDICYFRSPISPWRGPLWNSLFWVFYGHGLYFHHIKNQPPLGPPSTFPEHWPTFWPYLFSENVLKLLWYKIWVMFWLKKMISFSLGVFLDWETSIYFSPLFVHFRTLGDTLTYSALVAGAQESSCQMWQENWCLGSVSSQECPRRTWQATAIFTIIHSCSFKISPCIKKRSWNFAEILCTCVLKPFFVTKQSKETALGDLSWMFC